MDLTGVMICGSVWVAALVLAFADHHPTAALVVLAAHAVIVMTVSAVTNR